MISTVAAQRTQKSESRSLWFYLVFESQYSLILGFHNKCNKSKDMGNNMTACILVSTVLNNFRRQSCIVLGYKAKKVLK